MQLRYLIDADRGTVQRAQRRVLSSAELRQEGPGPHHRGAEKANDCEGHAVARR